MAEGLSPLFRAAWANDVCPKKAAVYRANHDPGPLVLGSIADISGRDLPPADLAWASFPCQDLSLAGAGAGLDGARSGLVWEWLRVLDEMKAPPPVLVAENVGGLASAKDGRHYRALHAALAERGYLAGPVLIDAARFLPQSRPRVFVIAVHARAFAAFAAFDDGRKIPRALLDADSQRVSWCRPESLRRAANGLSSVLWWRLPEPGGHVPRLAEVIEVGAPCDDPAKAACNLALVPERHMRGWLESGEPVAAGFRRTRKAGQTLEIRYDGLAGCLRTPEGGSSRQLLLLRSGDAVRTRLMTVRETARLMGAPDSYRFPGSATDGYKATGDAVAVPVARFLAETLLAPLALAARSR